MEHVSWKNCWTAKEMARNSAKLVKYGTLGMMGLGIAQMTIGNRTIDLATVFSKADKTHLFFLSTSIFKDMGDWQDWEMGTQLGHTANTFWLTTDVFAAYLFLSTVLPIGSEKIDGFVLNGIHATWGAGQTFALLDAANEMRVGPLEREGSYSKCNDPKQHHGLSRAQQSAKLVHAFIGLAYAGSEITSYLFGANLIVGNKIPLWQLRASAGVISAFSAVAVNDLKLFWPKSDEQAE